MFSPSLISFLQRSTPTAHCFGERLGKGLRRQFRRTPSLGRSRPWRLFHARAAFHDCPEGPDRSLCAGVYTHLSKANPAKGRPGNTEHTGPPNMSGVRMTPLAF
jgi:hypothetical protein